MHIDKFLQDLASLGGRILLSIIFIYASSGKIFYFLTTAAYMRSHGVPFAPILLIIAIVVELGGALLLLFGWKTRFAALVLFLFTLVVSLVFHHFWSYGPIAAQDQVLHLLKNFAIMGGMLYIMAYGPGRFSIEGRKKVQIMMS